MREISIEKTAATNTYKIFIDGVETTFGFTTEVAETFKRYHGMDITSEVCELILLEMNQALSLTDEEQISLTDQITKMMNQT